MFDRVKVWRIRSAGSFVSLLLICTSRTTGSGFGPTHPDELLHKCAISATGKFKAKSVPMIGISRPHLHNILIERKPVISEVAVRLPKRMP